MKLVTAFKQSPSLMVPDRILLITVSALIFIGLIMVASSSVAQTSEPLHYFRKQLIYVAIALSGTFILMHIPMWFWQKNTFVLLGLGMVFLVLVLIPGIGHEVNGSRRWVNLGLFSVQASEPARLCLLLYIAGYASRRQEGLNYTWGGLIKPMSLMVVASALLLLEPDYGAMAVLVVIAGMVLFMAGVRLVPLISLGIVGGVALAVLAVVSPYRIKRLASFSNPWDDPFDTGFQLIQALIAVGRGGVSGVGFGNSVQKLSYLPETHTDFLFAIFAEEFGLIGVVVAVGLFSLIIWRAFVIARRAVEQGQLFNGFVAYGLSSWVVMQAFINMGVNFGVLPTKGLTLPLLSYGGSSMLVTCAIIGFIFRVDFESRLANGGQDGA